MPPTGDNHNKSHRSSSNDSNVGFATGDDDNDIEGSEQERTS